MQKKKFKSYPFNFQEADLYAQKQEKDKMIESYLSLLDKHDYYQEAVKTFFFFFFASIRLRT